MQVSQVSNSYLPFSSAPGAAMVRKIDAAFNALFAEQDPREMLRAITSKGLDSYMAWKIEQMKRESAEKYMAQNHLTKEGVAAMPDAQRVKTEREVLEAVEQAVKEKIKEMIKRQSAGAKDVADKNVGMIIDMSM